MQHLEAYLLQYPEDSRAHATLGRVYAGLGQGQDAINSGQRAVELMPINADAILGPLRVEDLAAMYVLNGQYDEAINQLRKILAHPGFSSAKLMSIDPTWDALRNIPEFQSLLGN